MKYKQSIYTNLEIFLIAGEQKRACSLILTVVSGTFLNVRSWLANLKQNVGTFLAFLCSSNWNEWCVSKWWSKGPGVEFKVCGHWSREFHVDSTGFCHVRCLLELYQQCKLANNSRTSIIIQLSGKFEVLTGKSFAWSDTLTGHFC